MLISSIIASDEKEMLVEFAAEIEWRRRVLYCYGQMPKNRSARVQEKYPHLLLRKEHEMDPILMWFILPDGRWWGAQWSGEWSLDGVVAVKGLRSRSCRRKDRLLP